MAGTTLTAAGRSAAIIAAAAAFLLFAAAPASAAVTSSVAGNALTVATDGPAVAVTCSGGLVKVNGADPDSGGPLACAILASLQISASAAATIDLSGVTTAAFPAVSSQINGSGGNDTYLLAGGSVTIVDGGGSDTLDFSGAPVGVTVDLSQAAGQLQTIDGLGDTLSLTGSFRTLNGSTHDDVLTGSSGNDVISGGAGNDTLSGGAGDDTLAGGAGNDTVSGGAGNDIYTFQVQVEGNDTITDSGGTDELDVNSYGVGNTMIFSGSSLNSQGTTLAYSGIEKVVASGSTGNDVIDASAAAAGPTFQLIGGSGNDTLTGGPGNDILQGNDGNDTLAAWSGQDALYGDEGSDTFKVYSSVLLSGSPTATVATVVDSGAVGTDSLISYGGPGADAFVIKASSVADGSERVTFSGIEGSVSVYGGAGSDLFSVVSTPTGGVALDGEDGSDTYTVHWESLPGTVQITDRGSAGTDKLTVECAGTTLGTGTASNSGKTISFSGVEQLPSCTGSSAAASAAAASATTTASAAGTTAAATPATASPDAPKPAAARSGLAVQLVGAPVVRQVVWVLANTSPDAVTFEWQLCKGSSCVAIPAANAAGIRVRPEWLGKQLRVLVHARAEGGAPAATVAAKTASLRRR